MSDNYFHKSIHEDMLVLSVTIRESPSGVTPYNGYEMMTL